MQAVLAYAIVNKHRTQQPRSGTAIAVFFVVDVVESLSQVEDKAKHTFATPTANARFGTETMTRWELAEKKKYFFAFVRPDHSYFKHWTVITLNVDSNQSI